MKDQEIKPSRDGGFSDPSFITVGDKYPSTRKEKKRECKPFITCPSKRGQLAASVGLSSGTFQYLGGEYQNHYKLEAKIRLKNTEKYLKPNGFLHSSPGERHTGSGDYYGAFEKYEHIGQKETKDLTRKDTEKRNIFTCPGKRGTYGCAGTLINQENIRAWPAEHDSMKEHALAEKKRHRVLIGDKKPFQSAAPNISFFDSQEHVSVSKVYSWDEKCRLNVSDDSNHLNPKERALANADSNRPWKPAQNLRLGEEGAFNKFPISQVDIYDEQAVRRAMLPNRRNPTSVSTKNLQAHLKDRKPFKPSSGPKSKLTHGTCLVGINKHRLL